VCGNYRLPVSAPPAQQAAALTRQTTTEYLTVVREGYQPAFLASKYLTNSITA
jgi:hypothetical protein